MGHSEIDLDAIKRVVDISGWVTREEEMTKGVRRKFACFPLTESEQPFRNLESSSFELNEKTFTIQHPWFWKASIPKHHLEFWSEILAYHIGLAIGVPVPLTLPAKHKGQYGALSLMMVNVFKEETLVHGGSIIQLIKPDFEHKKGEEHSIHLIRKALEPSGKLDSIYAELFRQFLFDGIIGNKDRHQDNWGLCVLAKNRRPEESAVRLLPAFDNGSSLNRELEEVKITRMLGDPVLIENYIDRGKAHPRWDDGGNLLHLTHEQLIEHHLRDSIVSKSVVRDFVNFSMDAVQDAIGRVSALSRTCTNVEISDAREELIIRVIRRRRERIAELVKE